MSRKRLRSIGLNFLFVLLCLKFCATIESDTHFTSGMSQQPAPVPVQEKDSSFTIYFKLLYEELLDKTFLAALVLSFIYTPVYANACYWTGSAVTVLAGALMGEVFLGMPKLLLNIVSAFCFFFYGFNSFIYVYEMKPGDIKQSEYYSVPNVDQPEKMEPIKPKEEASIEYGAIKDDDVQQNHDQEVEDEEANYPQEHKEPEMHQESPTAQPQQTQKEPPKQHETCYSLVSDFCKAAFNYRFLKTKRTRFIFTTLLFILVDLIDDSFRTVVELRKKNGTGTVLLVALFVYLTTGLIILGIGFLVKKRLFRYLKKSPENIKTIKSIGCVVLIILSFVEIFD